MVKISSVLFTGVAAENLAVTWKDCGAKHGTMTDVEPKEIAIGSTGTMTGTGTLDEQITSGGFTIKLKAPLGISETYTGDVCVAKTFKLPLGLGSVSWAGLDCPVAAGTVKASFGFTTSSVIPAALATADIDVSATEQNGETALCISAHLERESMMVTDPQWEQYKLDFKKAYMSDDDEAERKELFKASLQRIEAGNALGDSVFGLTWTSDRHPTEMFGKGHKKPVDFVANAPVYEKKQPVKGVAAINWRTTDAVTPVKNQGQCGSCWAFSATSEIESQLALTGGDAYSIELSPQQITSCTPNTGTYASDGCQGGFTEGAYEYVKSAPGLTNSFNIGYQQDLVASSATVACSTFESKIEAIAGADASLSGGYATVSGYTYATPACTSGACDTQDLAKLAAALEETPVSVCVNAASWNDYTGGVMSSAQCGSMAADYQDHCVQATGFNTTAPTPYWIVRNSWASGWGEKGYIYLEYSKNTCGLADDATIATVALNLSPEQEAKAEASRDTMFHQATNGAHKIVV